MEPRLGPTIAGERALKKGDKKKEGCRPAKAVRYGGKERKILGEESTTKHPQPKKKKTDVITSRKAGTAIRIKKMNLKSKEGGKYDRPTIGDDKSKKLKGVDRA